MFREANYKRQIDSITSTKHTGRNNVSGVNIRFVQTNLNHYGLRILSLSTDALIIQMLERCTRASLVVISTPGNGCLIL